MPDDILDKFPMEQTDAKKPSKKRRPKRSTGAPVEEIDALAPADIETSQPEAVSNETPEPEPYDENPMGHEFDDLPSAPPLREQSEWEKFLISLPQDVLRLIYDCGLITQELLLANSAKTLLIPVGKFTPHQVQQLQAALEPFSWALSTEVAPELAALPDTALGNDTEVETVSHDEAPVFQREANAATRNLPICY
jgi:hypothetical protein